jgi:hypothetical protein
VTPEPIDALICAVLRGEAAPWPTGVADKAFLDRAALHGVAPLLNERVPQLPGWPAPVIEAIRDHARSRAFWELRHQQLMGQVVAALRAEGIEPIFFKGTALAYGLYANPVWRERADSDIIVAPHHAKRAGEVLQSLGFQGDPAAGDALVSYQDSYIKDAGNGGLHMIDLHRRITNAEMLSNILTHAELLAAARPMPGLCSGALSPGPIHALLLTCLHRATTLRLPMYEGNTAIYGDDRLIWSYDLHLQATAFGTTDWQELARVSSEKGLCQICLECLDLAAACFGTNTSIAVREAKTRPSEPVSAYLNSNAMRRSWLDLRSISGTANQLRYVCQRLFPSTAYMRAKYAATAAVPLPLLYARRVVAGFGKRLSAGGG